MVIWVTISQVVTVYAEAQRDEDTQAAAGQGLCGGAPPVLPPFGLAPWTPEHEFSLMSLCEPLWNAGRKVLIFTAPVSPSSLAPKAASKTVSPPLFLHSCPFQFREALDLLGGHTEVMQ